MFQMGLVSTSSGRSGRILAATIALGGILLALIALKFRVFTPLPTPPAATQATRPADEL